jgi:hypothetical protein
VKTNRIHKAIPFLAVIMGLFVPLQAPAAASSLRLPTFPEFIASVKTGQANLVTGVYVPGLFADPIVEQPSNDPGYVSSIDGVLTRFALADNYQVIGLLAHNNLAGATFFGLKKGQEIRLVYGDGRVKTYLVDRIARFQALQPNNLTSNFSDVLSNQVFSAGEIFNMFYAGTEHVTFQTCIAQGGEASWGRLFVTAVPKPLSNINPFLPFPEAWQNLLAARN